MKHIGIIIVVAVIIVGGIVLFSGDKPVDTSAKDAQGTESTVGENNDNKENFVKAPKFSLEDYNGNIVSTEDFSGKILVINSWAVWCPFCVKELEEFAQLQEFYGDEIAVIAIDRAESLQKTKEFTDSLGVTDRMTFLLDPRDTFYRDIGGFSMPETLFVDTEGNIIFHKRGPMDLRTMKKQIENVKNQ